MLDHKFWHKYFKFYDSLNIVGAYLDLLDTIIEEAGIKDGHVILDAGCGTGNFELRLKQKKPDLRAHIVGLDCISAGLDIYKKKNKDAYLVLADMTKRIPFENDYFDKIVCNNSIFTVSVKDRSKAFIEFYRVLKPGGKIVVSNVKYNWSPFPIYFDEVQCSIKEIGFFKTAIIVIKKIIPAIKMFYYNYTILKEVNFGDWRCMDDQEQIRKLAKVGFKNISPDKKVYANQAILNSAEK